MPDRSPVFSTLFDFSLDTEYRIYSYLKQSCSVFIELSRNPFVQC